MPKSLVLFFALLVFSGCTTGNVKQEAAADDTLAIHSLKETTFNQPGFTTPAPTKNAVQVCDCAPAAEESSQGNSVTFSRWQYINDKQGFDSIYRRYAHDSIRLSIKSIKLSGFDTIPAMMQVFKNVEQIRLSGIAALFGKAALLKGLDQFPRLIFLDIEGCHVTIDSTDNPLKNLELLIISKSKVKGISSFRQIPRLKTLLIGHAGFDVFPKDFNSLTCLQVLNIEEYKFGIGCVDLRGMNLADFKCLRKLRVWGGSSGLPQGLDSAGNVELILRPWLMDTAERKAYSAYKKRIVQRK